MNSKPPQAQRAAQIWREARRSCALALFVIAAEVVVVSTVFNFMPNMQDGDKAVILQHAPPTTLSDAKAIRAALQRYGDMYPSCVAVGIVCCYVALQTLCVPGTTCLSMLSGAAFGQIKGLALVAVTNMMGSACCYGMSRACGKNLCDALWPARMEWLAAEVAARRRNLMHYILFLRLTPLLPNAFVNVACPLVGVPLPHFMLGTLVGCLPNTFVAVHAGTKLSDIESVRDLYDTESIVVVACGLAIAVATIMFRPRALQQDASLAAKSHAAEHCT